jgi:NhaA family Na+:H+ antiporter
LARLLTLAKRPLDRFLQIEAASGILLLLTAAIALLWANSRWVPSYSSFWHTVIGVRVYHFTFERSLEWVINDVLMVIFFFLVGLEIRRELHQGELSEWRRAALPFAAALGGMLVPALLYLGIAGNGPTHSGWGVPMATDIAFAVGVLALLGRRVPPALRVLLLALAVIDDLGAILVIALFYSSGIDATDLLVAAGGVGCIFLMQALGLRHKAAYVVPGMAVWGGIYASGIHPTIAGVIIGMVTPVKVWLGPEGFVQQVQSSLDRLSKQPLAQVPRHDLHHALQVTDQAKREAMSPAESLIETLHPWVAYLIMPLFALANAGVAIDGITFDAATTRLVVAVIVGLVVGKLVGVVLACQLTLRFNLASLPRGLSFRHVVVLGLVAGIGFTMALFVAQLAFNDIHLLGAAKLAVLIASGASGVLAMVIGPLLLRPDQPLDAAQTADEAECSTEM